MGACCRAADESDGHAHDPQCPVYGQRPVRWWMTPTRQGKAEMARRWQELQALERGGMSERPPYGWLPCFACGSRNHYVDDCPDDNALVQYWADVEAENSEALDRGDQEE
jgi:hypothetical protein